MTTMNVQLRSERRPATTLVEVLVAIFVMAIGCLAILAMFPLGAINMSRSIKDDRCAHSAANAKTIAISRHIAFDTQLESVANNLFFFTNPTGTPGTAPFQDAPLDGPSYPVLVDPIGWTSYAGLGQQWLAGLNGNNALLCRRPLSFAMSSPTTQLWCMLLDDINFGTNGLPATPSGSVERAGKYTWAWLLRRPRNGVKAACDVTILVYEQRPLTTAPGFQLAPREFVFANSQWNAARPNVATFFVPNGSPVPPIKEGGWILDATPTVTTVNKTPLLTSNSHAKFYRVVNIGELTPAAGGNTIDVEVAIPIQNSADFTAVAPTFVVLDGLIEVFECGDLWRAWTN